MSLQNFDLATLLEIRRKQDTIPRFWANFFTQQINFETPYIDFERVNTRYKKLAPFVAPNVQGRIIKTQGSSMQRFSPAYVKPKSAIDPNKVIRRQAGEMPYQPMSNEARRNAVIAEEIKEQRSRIDNREEWLAARAIIDGEVTIEGEDYPAKTVNFNRDADLTTALVGAAQWDETTATPLVNLKNLRGIAWRKSGVAINDIIFGADAWDLFVARLALSNPTTGNLLDTTYRGSTTDISRIVDGFDGAEYVGRISGREGQGGFNCYVYTGYYEQDDGAGGVEEVAMMDPLRVVGVGDIQGTRCYGAIQDARAGYRALPVFMKMWEENDPSVEYIMSQSAPLFVPGEPNASFSMLVA